MSPQTSLPFKRREVRCMYGAEGDQSNNTQESHTKLSTGNARERALMVTYSGLMNMFRKFWA